MPRGVYIMYRKDPKKEIEIEKKKKRPRGGKKKSILSLCRCCCSACFVCSALLCSALLCSALLCSAWLLLLLQQKVAKKAASLSILVWALPPNRSVTVRALPYQSAGLVTNHHSKNGDNTQYQKGQTDFCNDLLCTSQRAEEITALSPSKVLSSLLYFGTGRPDGEVACILAFAEGLLGWW